MRFLFILFGLISCVSPGTESGVAGAPYEGVYYFTVESIRQGEGLDFKKTNKHSLSFFELEVVDKNDSILATWTRFYPQSEMSEELDYTCYADRNWFDRGVSLHFLLDSSGTTRQLIHWQQTRPIIQQTLRDYLNILSLDSSDITLAESVQEKLITKEHTSNSLGKDFHLLFSACGLNLTSDESVETSRMVQLQEGDEPVIETVSITNNTSTSTKIVVTRRFENYDLQRTLNNLTEMDLPELKSFQEITVFDSILVYFDKVDQIPIEIDFNRTFQTDSINFSETRRIKKKN